MVGKVAPWVVLAAARRRRASRWSGMLVFGVPFRGSVVLFALARASLFVLVLPRPRAASSRRARPRRRWRTRLGAARRFLPGFMLSGLRLPADATCRRCCSASSYLFPARYMHDRSPRAVFLKGAGLAVLWPQIAALAVYAVVALTVASAALSRGGCERRCSATSRPAHVEGVPAALARPLPAAASSSSCRSPAHHVRLRRRRRRARPPHGVVDHDRTRRVARRSSTAFDELGLLRDRRRARRRGRRARR